MKKWNYLAAASAAVMLAACGGDPLSTPAPKPSLAITDEPQGPISGAVFTNIWSIADGACTGTDANIYASRLAVGLNGGPRRDGSAGMPAGGYFVKVTDPSGATLLGIGGTPDVPVRVAEVGANGKFVQCYQLWDIVNQATDPTQKGYLPTPNNGGEYKVWVSSRSDFDPRFTKTDNFKVREDEPVVDNEEATLIVQKFYDKDTDGIQDADEPLIAYNDNPPAKGWLVNIFGKTSPGNGEVDQEDVTTWAASVLYGTYGAREAKPIETNWFPTTATLVTGISVSEQNPTPDPIVFGNVCVGAGGGLTLGYWSNRNGERDLNNLGGGLAANLLRLRTLNLRNANGTAFDPTTYSAYRTWLLNGNAVNMAYMLSVQMSAMSNNVATGKVNGGALIYAPGAFGANLNGFATVNEVLSEANASLFTNGLTNTAGAARTYQEALKNALDNANNNRNFVQATPCAFSFANPAAYYDVP